MRFICIWKQWLKEVFDDEIALVSKGKGKVKGLTCKNKTTKTSEKESYYWVIVQNQSKLMIVMEIFVMKVRMTQSELQPWCLMSRKCQGHIVSCNIMVSSESLLITIWFINATQHVITVIRCCAWLMQLRCNNAFIRLCPFVRH